MAFTQPSAYLTRAVPDLRASTRPMTRAGTYTKTGVLLALVALTGGYAYANPPSRGIVLVALFGGLVLAGAGTFRPRLARYVAPVYALLEGVVLGTLSQAYAHGQMLVIRGTQVNGAIVPEAVVLTGTVVAATWLVYSMGLVRVTTGFARKVMAATLGLAVFYLIDMVLGAFGGHVPLAWSTSGAGILFSVAVVVLAAANLVVDFDYIERAVAARVDADFEWAAALGVVVAIVWLYLELLRLLAKLGSR